MIKQEFARLNRSLAFWHFPQFFFSDMEAGNPEEVYERISAITYPVFLATTLIAHFLLIICAVFFSPKQMSFLRFLLVKTSFLQVLVDFFRRSSVLLWNVQEDEQQHVLFCFVHVLAGKVRKLKA